LQGTNQCERRLSKCERFLRPDCPSAFSRFLGSLWMSSSPEAGKRKTPDAQHEHVITRQAIKDEMRETDTLQERELLRDAIMAMYRGGCYGQKQALEYGWSENFVRFKVHHMPTGLKADDERLDLVRHASDRAEVSYKNLYTDSELHECLLAACTTTSKKTEIFRKFGVGKTTFYKMYNMLPKNIKELSLDEKRQAVHAIQRPTMGPKSYLTPDKAFRSCCCRSPKAARRWMDDSNTLC
jgi:hypothetical protein